MDDISEQADDVATVDGRRGVEGMGSAGQDHQRRRGAEEIEAEEARIAKLATAERERLLARAARVIAMGGYNTVSEVLAFGKPEAVRQQVASLVAPLGTITELPRHRIGGGVRFAQSRPDGRLLRQHGLVDRVSPALHRAPQRRLRAGQAGLDRAERAARFDRVERPRRAHPHRGDGAVVRLARADPHDAHELDDHEVPRHDGHQDQQAEHGQAERPAGGPKTAFKPVEEGAATQVYAATGDDIPGGAYLADGAVAPYVADHASDDEAAARLWTLSEELVGERFPTWA